MKNKNIFMIGLFAAMAIVASTTMVGSQDPLERQKRKILEASQKRRLIAINL